MSAISALVTKGWGLFLCAILDHLFPTGGNVVPSQGFGRFFQGLPVAAANGVHFQISLEREKVRSLSPTVGMGLAHETVADHANFKCFRHNGLLRF